MKRITEDGYKRTNREMKLEPHGSGSYCQNCDGGYPHDGQRCPNCNKKALPLRSKKIVVVD